MCDVYECGFTCGGKGPVNAAVQLAGLTSNSPAFASHLTITVLGFRVCTVMLGFCVMVEVKIRPSCRLGKNSANGVTFLPCSLCVCHIFFILSLIPKHLDWFCVLAIINNVAINMEAQVPLGHTYRLHAWMHAQ